MINTQQIQLVNHEWAAQENFVSSQKWKRFSYLKISPWLKMRQMISISGLRRTGKSTLLGQLREAYIQDKGLQPKESLFFSFENEDRQTLLPVTDLEDLLTYYFNHILVTHPSNLSRDILICLDELQNVESWQKVLKTYYDLSPHIKFIISGSSSLYHKEGSESLVGRILDFTLLPLTFGEFLELTGNNNIKTIQTWDDFESFPATTITADRLNLFEKFLLLGGFPEATVMFSQNIPIIEIQHYIRESIILKILNKDLAKFFNLKTSEQDLLLFKILCFESGQTLNAVNLAKESGFSPDSVKTHLQALIGSGLIASLRRYDTKIRSISKAHPKIYITSPAIITSYLGHDNIPPGSLIGHLAESYAYLRFLELTNHKEIYFASPGRDQEVDFYLPEKKFLLEVKYTDHIELKTINYLLDLGKQYQLKTALITKSPLSSLEIKSIPLCYL